MGTRYLIEALVEEEIEQKAQKMLLGRKKLKYFSEEETRENVKALYERLKIGHDGHLDNLKRFGLGSLYFVLENCTLAKRKQNVFIFEKGCSYSSDSSCRPEEAQIMSNYL